MKKSLILSTVSLCLLATANVMASDGLKRSQQPSGGTDNLLLWSRYDQGYVISNYRLMDLENFEEKIRRQEQNIKQLKDKQDDIARENRSKDSELRDLKQQLQEQSRTINDLKRAQQELSNKIR
ncbi:hypothetical protein M6G53_10525 [Serratia nevei]|uniref:hypothetical protein n=1 Tax=Serratia nevei TaxID=2703794 RepID=UPI00209FA410|nr:hypothetical protein [Serratia nevei]MCP1105820.1 hypothetical protein [Serratia nevei]